MCNLYRLEHAPDAIAALARAMGQTVLFPEGVPNFQPRDVRISERAPMLRASVAEASEGSGAVELVERRRSWPGPSGKPVFNYRSEGRRFAPAGRCVVLADGFFEYTAPEDPPNGPPNGPKPKRKDRWLFTWPDQEWFGIAGIVRAHPQVGEAFTLLTCPPGPDVVPIHSRQIVLLSPADCFRWLSAQDPAEALLHPLPGGTLAVSRG